MEEHYPKNLSLREGSQVVLRPLESTDEEALKAFFVELPRESIQFLKDDVHDPAVVARFCRNIDPNRVWCLLALDSDGRVVADATLHMADRGWRRHVGEIRVVVHPRFHKRGLATVMIHDLVNHASSRGLKKLEAQILDSQRGALLAFDRLGFSEEARLKNHALDLEDNPHDLLIMTTSVADLWRKMEDLMVDMDVSRAQERY